MKVYYIESNRFYPLKDVGRKRRPVVEGDLVSFLFPHDANHTEGRVTRVYEMGGKAVHDIEKV